MGVASLILAIISFLVSFSIFKDLSLILAILSIVLGIICLCKKKNKAMCIIAIVLSVISLIVSFSDTSDTQVTSVNSSSSKTVENSKQEEIYKLGDTVTIKNRSGDEYTLQITAIKETEERNEFSDKKPAQVFVIDYTYKCDKTDDGLYVSDMNFKIIDEEGEIGDTYPITVKDPQEISSGITCKAQLALCVYNKSNKIKLQYFDNMFNGKPDVVYEIEI